MPKIIDHDKQQRALKDITSALKEVAIVNAFLLTANPAGKYTVSFTDKNNGKHSCTLYTPDKEDLDILVMNYKDQLKAKILNLAEEYRIALEPAEQAMLEDQDLPAAKPEASVSVFADNPNPYLGE